MNNEESSITIEFSEIPLSDFQEMDKEEQIETMRTWFLENFEDPVERTPYESREGGYIYIWGGPFEAHDELSVFGDYVPDDVIEELADELSADCPYWTCAESPSDYEDSYFNLILSDNEFYDSFNKSIEHIKGIVSVSVDAETKNHLLGILYASVITSIETYLSDAFINTVINNTDNMRKFVAGNPEFSKKTFKFSDIYDKYDNINEEVKEYLLSQLWHNLKKIKPMYKTALNVDFPENLDPIFSAIEKRHDLVHRNGKDKDGSQVIITESDLNTLIENASNFIEYVNNQFSDTDEADF